MPLDEREDDMSTTEIATVEPETLPAARTPMEMIDRALTSGASVETLEKLMALQERWEAAQAKKAYIAAMAKARTEFKPLLKRHAGYNNRYKHEMLDDVCEAVDEALSRHGFSYDWTTQDAGDGRVSVTCVLTHADGYSKSNTLTGDPKGAADAKANMNEFQRLGAGVTYLQRITLKAVLGIAAAKDDDARSLGSEVEFDTAPWIERIDAATTGDAVKAVQRELKAEEAKMPSWARDILTAHFAAHIKRLKEMNSATA